MKVETLIRDKIPEYIYKLLKSIGDESEKMGYSAYVVGGFVRDLILGRPNLDVDIIIEGDGIDFASKFAEINHGKAKTHKQFGTSVITLKDGFKIDVATARTEIYERPGALPTVKFGSIKDDLSRRDFTINAMAVDLSRDSFGRLVDFLDGISDLENGIIRVIHDLSFSDDPTRIFRAIRFEQRFGFAMDDHTEELLSEAVKSNFLNTITKQRLRNELLLILKEIDVIPPLVRMSRFGLMRYIHPQVSLDDTIISMLGQVKELISSTDASLEYDRIDEVLLNLMVLLDQLNEMQIGEVCENLVFNSRYTETLKLCKTRLKKALDAFEDTSPSMIYRLLNGLPLDVLIFGLIKSASDIQEDSIMSYLTDLGKVKPFVNGNDLKELGYPESPLYTEILSKTFDAQLDGIINDKKQAMEFVNKNYDK